MLRGAEPERVAEHQGRALPGREVLQGRFGGREGVTDPYGEWASLRKALGQWL